MTAVVPWGGLDVLSHRRMLKGLIRSRFLYHQNATYMISVSRLASLALLAVLTLAVAPGALAQNCNVEGAWAPFSLTFTDPDGTVREITIGDPPGLKILSDTHWAFVERSNNPDAPVSGGGGTYTVEGNTYTERVVYHTGSSFVGQEISFDCRVEGDRWYQSGMLPNGVKLDEVYHRAK